VPTEAGWGDEGWNKKLVSSQEEPAYSIQYISKYKLDGAFAIAWVAFLPRCYERTSTGTVSDGCSQLLASRQSAR
jgi:hypothetical protein